jgi:glyoxylase-like metal-dependent hydrolase (beta-lactamase superfamily II)
MHVSNVWLFEDDQGHQFLIDTGETGERLFLRMELLLSRMLRPNALTAVLLTHRHRDHAGNAVWLREKFGCPVFCHDADAQYLNGDPVPQKLCDQPMPLMHKTLCMLEDKRPAKCPIDDTYSEGPWRWGFYVIPTPGHTEGSVMLYHEPTRTLFSGDSIVVGYPPFRMFTQLSLAKAEYSLDVVKCHQSVKDFLADPPPIKRLCSGHGALIDTDVPTKLAGLL